MSNVELKKRTEAEVSSYFDGYRSAVIEFAWWKDGTQYVGCGVKTLNQAIDDSRLMEKVVINSLKREEDGLIKQEQENPDNADDR